MTRLEKNYFDMYLKREEYITAQEYMKRREAGLIDPKNVEIVPPCSILPFGGFKIRLDKPQYVYSPTQVFSHAG